MQKYPKDLKVSKSRKQFLVFSILPKYERKTRENYPGRAYNQHNLKSPKLGHIVKQKFPIQTSY